VRAGDRVSIRVGRERAVVFGTLTDIDLPGATGRVLVEWPARRGRVIRARYYVRDLKRIKPEAVGRREARAKAEVEKRRLDRG
jgi:hypothetical protein